jgi:subtilisin family serine protease
MKKRFMLVMAISTAFLLAVSIPALAKNSGPMGKIIAAVEDGGGKVYLVPDVSLEPFNFSDFPEAFDAGILSWDHDVIDVEKLAPEANGSGVYVAILDTGLAANWRDYFPEERIATELGRGFTDNGIMQDEKAGRYTPNVVESSNFIGEHPHGTHVSSTVIGYSFFGTPVQGVAPQATIIPVKVLTTYNGLKATFGTDAAVAAGIAYVGDLATAMPGSRFVINMSLGSLSEISEIEADAIDYAIAAGVIIVAAAGNNGTEGMGSPGSYAPVISVGSTGWAFDDATCTGEWVVWDDGCFISGGFWNDDVPEDVSAEITYVSEFSAREYPGGPGLGDSDQELDVLAPGSWVVGPYPLGVGQSHLPWWSNGKGNGVAGQYFFVGGTSMASPHVAGIAALMVQADPGLMQADVETMLRATTDVIPAPWGQLVADPDLGGLIVVTWDADAVGHGLVQADAAVDAATP